MDRPSASHLTNSHLTAYRMQDADRSVKDLSDPEQQYSFPMSQNEVAIRHGVSGCLTLADLAAYIATHAIEASTPILVRIEGPASDDTPCDEDEGEVLLLPVTASSLSEEAPELDTAFFDLVGELVDLHWEQGLGCAALREIAAERI